MSLHRGSVRTLGVTACTGLEEAILSKLLCGSLGSCTRYPEADLSDEQARTYLGQFGISNMLALEPLYILSGGQKSRVAIALMAYNNPHILVGLGLSASYSGAPGADSLPRAHDTLYGIAVQRVATFQDFCSIMLL